MIDPHPAFVRFVKEYNPNLVVLPNRSSDPWEQYVICQPVFRMEEVFGMPGVFAIKKHPYPVLAIPQALELDNRVIKALHANRFENVRDPEEEIFEGRRRAIKEYEDQIDAWARDEGFWHFQKQFGAYNMANVPNVDPTRASKEYEDRYGHEPPGYK